MTSFHLFDSTGERDGSLWPLEDTAGGALPSISAWRQWGHSWTGGQPDAAPGETGFSERLAGVLGVDGAYYENWGIFGSSLMDGFNGWGYYLHNTTKPSDYNKWPWEPYHGIDGFMWGVNDFGTRHVTGSITGGPDPWPTQRDMWRSVWKEEWRSIIQRSIAGGVFPGERITPSNLSIPTTGDHPSVVYGGPGGGGWTFISTTESSGAGYWRTSTTGATVTITVPADYDTGYLAFRHTVPGSYFPGAQTLYGADGTGPYGSAPFDDTDANLVPVAGRPAIIVGAANSEVTLAPASVTTATAGVTSIVRDPRVMRNRRLYAPSTYPGDTMTLMDRMAVPITPGTTRTVTITVGTVPAGGWYGFDSWEIEAQQINRPPVIPANVQPPARWGALYFLGVNTWAAMDTTAQLASDDIATVCGEWGDPGICVADIRAALVGHELDYAVLYAAGVTPATGGGIGSGALAGDGTHPHSIGARLIGAAYRDGLIAANLPAYRYETPYSAERGMARA